MPTPVPGERRSGTIETVEWDGQRWNPVEPHDANAPDTSTQGGLMGMLSSYAKTINPMNAINAVLHPVDTAKAYAAERALHPYRSALSDMFAPLTGGAGFSAGERIGRGDIAGGAGEALGDLTLAALPIAGPKAVEALAAAPAAAVRGAGRTASAIGRGAEAVGTSLPARHLQRWGTAGAIMHGDPALAAGLAAGPSALEYGGKGLQKLGSALEGLGVAPEEYPSLPAQNPAARAKWAQAREVPYRGPSGVTSSAASVSPAPAPSESVFQRMKREGAFGGDRTTGSFEEGPGGLSSIKEMERYEAPLQEARPEPPPPAAPGFSTGTYPASLDEVPTSKSLRALSAPTSPIEAAQATPVETVPASQPGQATPPSLQGLDNPQLDIFGDTAWPGKLLSDLPDNQLLDLASQGDANAERALRQRGHIADWSLGRGQGSSRSARIVPNQNQG